MRTFFIFLLILPILLGFWLRHQLARSHILGMQAWRMWTVRRSWRDAVDDVGEWLRG